VLSFKTLDILNTNLINADATEQVILQKEIKKINIDILTFNNSKLFNSLYNKIKFSKVLIKEEDDEVLFAIAEELENLSYI
jgi:hypothetical protein